MRARRRGSAAVARAQRVDARQRARRRGQRTARRALRARRPRRAGSKWRTFMIRSLRCSWCAGPARGPPRSRRRAYDHAERPVWHSGIAAISRASPRASRYRPHDGRSSHLAPDWATVRQAVVVAAPTVVRQAARLRERGAQSSCLAPSRPWRRWRRPARKAAPADDSVDATSDAAQRATCPGLMRRITIVLPPGIVGRPAKSLQARGARILCSRGDGPNVRLQASRIRLAPGNCTRTARPRPSGPSPSVHGRTMRVGDAPHDRQPQPAADRPGRCPEPRTAVEPFEHAFTFPRRDARTGVDHRRAAHRPSVVVDRHVDATACRRVAQRVVQEVARAASRGSRDRRGPQRRRSARSRGRCACSAASAARATIASRASAARSTIAALRRAPRARGAPSSAAARPGATRGRRRPRARRGRPRAPRRRARVPRVRPAA